ncbi:MAG: hypothetical protein SGI89_00890 [bacterium]|nr:hypothetical protein [bacterium]
MSDRLFFPAILKALIIVSLFTFVNLPSTTSAQSKIKYTKPPQPRNAWSVGLNYGENGFGPFASYFVPVGKTTDLTFNLSFSGVTDAREIERYDIFGNSVTIDKINRVFMMPFSIGIRKELFKEEIEGGFIPVINLGISPTLVLTNPYDKSFFKAIPFTQSHFAAGAYGGLGVNFTQSDNISMNISLNYYYLPIIGDGVQSLQNNTITNVGGMQLAFGVNFLR